MTFRFEGLSADFVITHTRIVGRLCGLAMSSKIPFRYTLDIFEVWTFDSYLSGPFNQHTWAICVIRETQ